MAKRYGALAFLLLVGCAYQPNPQSDSFVGDMAAFNGAQLVQRLAEQRAPFDLGCEIGKMRFISIEGWRTVGVEGCGKRATYTYVAGAGWVMNNSSSVEANGQ